MPGVILSLDQWTTFGDTGLGGGKLRQEASALLQRETPGPGRAAWKLGCSMSTPPCPAHGWVPGGGGGQLDNWPSPRAQPPSCGLSPLLPLARHPQAGCSYAESTECLAWVALVGVGISGCWLSMNQTELGRKRGCGRSWRWDLSPWGEGTGLCFSVGHMERGSGPSSHPTGEEATVPGGRQASLHLVPSRRVGEGENRPPCLRSPGDLEGSLAESVRGP